MDKIIYFDIDDTLINTHKLAMSFYEQISRESDVSLEKVIEIKEKYKLTLKYSADYFPEDLIKFLTKELNIQIKSNPFDNKKLYEEALFPETKEALEKLSKKYKLGIFSEGFEEYQMKKIKLSGIYKYFNKNLVVIERRKMANKSLHKIKPGNYIVEDKIEVVEKFVDLKYKNFKTFWINRKNDELISGVNCIKNLNQISEIID